MEDMSYPSFGVMLVGLAGGWGAGLLCWKCTQSWRDAARPGPTEGNRRHSRIESIAFWCSIGSALIGVFVTGQILHLIGFN
jgi:hypothetical protein